MMAFGTAYFLVMDYSGKEVYSDRIGRWGMWLKYIGAIGIVHAWFLQGILGGVRRVNVSTPGQDFLTWFSIPFATILLIGIYMATYNLWKTVTFNPTTAPTSDAKAA